MQKLYPKSITGFYRKLKNVAGYFLLLIYFGASWIRWERAEGIPDQAILVDLPARRAYLFGIEIWPDELYYLAGILILAALGLFFVTSLYGRIWCGYTCPHTVFTDIFFKIEAFFQGDRNSRIKLDEAEWDNEKIKKKVLTHLCWLLVGFSFAFGWVCYFYGAKELLWDILRLKVASGGVGWLVALTFATYFFAGFVRDNVCVYMCPYGRFQSVMLDNDSSIVTYHDWRGEPRGKEGKGDCIDCGKCVVVCPMGIDIRDGLQISCIGCGLCVDACNSVMEKLDRPLGLIDYDSVNGSVAKMAGKTYKKKLLHFKTVLFASIFTLVSLMLLYTLLNKEILEINVIRDRQTMFTILPDGAIRNVYSLKIKNKSGECKDFILTVSDLEQVYVKGYGSDDYKKELEFCSKAEKEIHLFVKTFAKNLKPKSKITIQLVDKETGERYEKSSIFISK